MSTVPRFILVLICSSLVLAGCNASLPLQKRATVEAPSEQPPVRPTAAAAEPAAGQELSSDVLYSLLVAEISTQRNDLARAYTHYLYAARTAGIAYAAERATRIAVFLKDPAKARVAADLWVKLAPDSIHAHRSAAMQYLASGDEANALEQMGEMIRIAAAKGDEGFLAAAELLAHEPDKLKALGLMRELVGDETLSVQARYALVVLALGAERYDEAEREARRILDEKPDWYQVRVLLSRILAQKGDAEGALKLLRDSVAQYPDNALLRTAYAQRLVEQEQFEPAYEQFSALSKMLPDSQDVHFALGVLAVELGHAKAAREHLGWLYERGKRQSEAAYFLGRLEQKEERVEEAMSWYRKVESPEQRPQAVAALAGLLAEQGQLSEAREALQDLRIASPEQSVWLYLQEADLLKEHGTSTDVWAVYEKGLRAHPDDPDLLYARAIYAAGQDRLDIMEADLHAIIAKDPSHADALNALGYTLAEKTDRYQEALGYIRKALELKPDSAAVLDSMGWVLYRLGRIDESLSYLRRALNAAGFDGEIAGHLGEVLWVSGKTKEARRVWDGGLAQDPKNTHILEAVERFEKKKQ